MNVEIFITELDELENDTCFLSLGLLPDSFNPLVGDTIGLSSLGPYFMQGEHRAGEPYRFSDFADYTPWSELTKLTNGVEVLERHHEFCPDRKAFCLKLTVAAI